MVFDIPPHDPAISLWLRASPGEREKISDLLASVPVQIGLIADRLGLNVKSKTLPSEISGMIRKVGQSQFEIQVNNTDVPVRQRFTVGHEIAHYLLHRSKIDADGITDNILYRSKLSNREEAEANKLAAALLLPWERVMEWYSSRFGGEPISENVDHIARAFKVSRLAVGYRFGV